MKAAREGRSSEVYGVEAKADRHRRRHGRRLPAQRRLRLRGLGRLDETAHQPNENAKLENIIGDAKVFATLALRE